MAWDGRRLKRAREQAGLTQHRLAERVGCRQETVARIVTNVRPPSVDLLLRLAKALRVEVGELLR